MSGLRKLIQFQVQEWPSGTFSLVNVHRNECLEPGDYQSPSKGAFFMGDLIPNFQNGSKPRLSDAFLFVLKNQCLVRAYPGSNIINNIEICSHVALKDVKQYDSLVFNNPTLRSFLKSRKAKYSTMSPKTHSNLPFL